LHLENWIKREDKSKATEEARAKLRLSMQTWNLKNCGTLIKIKGNNYNFSKKQTDFDACIIQKIIFEN